MFQHGGSVFFQNTCIDFSANINFLGIPDLVMQAARSGLVAAAQHPQEQSGTLEEHIAQWEGVNPEHVFCCNGDCKKSDTGSKAKKSAASRAGI